MSVDSASRRGWTLAKVDPEIAAIIELALDAYARDEVGLARDVRETMRQCATHPRTNAHTCESERCALVLTAMPNLAQEFQCATVARESLRLKTRILAHLIGEVRKRTLDERRARTIAKASQRIAVLDRASKTREIRDNPQPQRTEKRAARKAMVI